MSNNKVGGDVITFKYRYRKQIIIGIIITFILLAGLTPTVISHSKKKDNNKPAVVVNNKDKLEKNKETTEELLKVDIKGEIINPGIYSLSASSRVIDVIEKAGGLTEQANTTVINLSKKISDEMVIIIYSNAQVEEFKKTKEVEQQVQNSCIQQDENSLKNDACITTNTTTSTKISINTASVQELQTLPGIGETKAKDIIAFREQNGPFTSIEELTKISGIGEAVLAKIKDYITI